MVILSVARIRLDWNVPSLICVYDLFYPSVWIDVFYIINLMLFTTLLVCELFQKNAKATAKNSTESLLFAGKNIK